MSSRTGTWMPEQMILLLPRASLTARRKPRIFSIPLCPLRSTREMKLKAWRFLGSPLCTGMLQLQQKLVEPAGVPWDPGQTQSTLFARQASPNGDFLCLMGKSATPSPASSFGLFVHAMVATAHDAGQPIQVAAGRVGLWVCCSSGYSGVRRQAPNRATWLWVLARVKPGEMPGCGCKLLLQPSFSVLSGSDGRVRTRSPLQFRSRHSLDSDAAV